MKSANSDTREQLLIAVAIVAAALIHVSIAASQTMLGVGIALLIFQRRSLPFPRIWIPLLALFLWTALADICSGDAWTGRAQIKKFFVFLFLPLIYGVFSQHFERVQQLMMAWLAAASASGLWSLAQFVRKYHETKQTGANFYVSYLGHRITGFESHWMTFGALQLAVLSLIVAHWFFSDRRFPAWVYIASCAVLGAAIVLGWTRSIWLAAIPAILYLVWCWRPKMTFLVPVIAAVAFAAAPAGTRERLVSLVQPHGETDSNQHRVVTFRTGIEMIKAHPLLGIGPEEIGRQFNQYLPPDIKRPLPVGYYGHLHNMYLQYAAERGIPGLLMVLWLIAWTVVDSARAICAAERPSCELFALHGAIAVTIGVLVGGCFEYNLGDSEVLMMFVCVIALAYAAVYRLATTPFRVREGQAELVAQPSGSPGDSTQANQATAWRLTARAARA